MGQLKAFSSTTITLFKTQDDLEKLLAKRGISASRWTHFAETKDQPGMVRFEFEWQRNKDRPPMGFRIDVAYKYVAGPKGGNQGTTREQAGRALFWHVKNLFDAVDFGIADMEQAFMPYLLGQGDRTIYEQMAPRLEALRAGDMPALLIEGRDGRGERS